ncbi:hypothetical protein ECP03052938_5196 [Escherichia coli p0305293.8]|nr:hypothetical protein ECP03052938_5196 [Escherichia coli p0305293.8]
MAYVPSRSHGYSRSGTGAGARRQLQPPTLYRNAVRNTAHFTFTPSVTD